MKIKYKEHFAITGRFHNLTGKVDYRGTKIIILAGDEVEKIQIQLAIQNNVMQHEEDWFVNYENNKLCFSMLCRNGATAKMVEKELTGSYKAWRKQKWSRSRKLLGGKLLGNFVKVRLI